ncbi:MAG: CPBP family intramembrane metalloprotease [Cyanobacteria bacterium HKST-UBA06]|nr:CPBP family intramembrane metalloprotease [Cyanobacteria bacterium HKST-UBA04]MCA9807127.1 CPBP family intramembrane metalloprotease [Cyanobacteria bacterium HKST-UBA06]
MKPVSPEPPEPGSSPKHTPNQIHRQAGQSPLIDRDLPEETGYQDPPPWSVWWVFVAAMAAYYLAPLGGAFVLFRGVIPALSFLGNHWDVTLANVSETILLLLPVCVWVMAVAMLIQRIGWPCLAQWLGVGVSMDEKPRSVVMDVMMGGVGAIAMVQLWLGFGMFGQQYLMAGQLPAPAIDVPIARLWTGSFLLPPMALLVYPLLEELCFRGLFQPCARARYGPVLAVLITALLFTQFHGSRYGLGPVMVYIFMQGTILSTLRAMTGSIVPSLTAHCMANGLMLLLPYVISSLV